MHRTVFAAFLAGLCFAGVASSDRAADKNPSTAAVEPAIADLQELRITAATEGQHLAQEMFRAGSISNQEVIHWSNKLLAARLDAEPVKVNRIALLKENVALAQKNEKLEEARARTGLSSSLDLTAARLAVIEARVQLAKESQKN